MLNKRLDEISRQPDAPFLTAGSGVSSLVRPVTAAVISAQIQEEKALDAMESLITEIERALIAQLRFAGEDPVVADAAEAIMVGLYPAVERAVMRLAEQAAAEAEAQLPGRQVGVELREGIEVHRNDGFPGKVGKTPFRKLAHEGHLPTFESNFP